MYVFAVYASRTSHDLWSDRRHMCITVSRRGKCFCDGRLCATVTKCEKDGKVYAERVHWVPENEWCFKHLTEREDMARRLLFASLAAALSYSSISPRTSRVSDYLLSLCLHFCFHVRKWQTYGSEHTFCKQELLIAFRNGTDVCAQATPLLAFLKRDKLHS